MDDLNERQLGSKMRFLVLRRDENKCRICGKQDGLEVHHIQALYLGGKTQMKNLITLCNGCHKYAPDTKGEFDSYISSPEIFKMMSLWNSCKDTLTKVAVEVEISNVQEYYLHGLIGKEVMETLVDHIRKKHNLNQKGGEVKCAK